MNKDDDPFGWPNNFNQEDEPIIFNWQYFKDLLLGMLAIFSLSIVVGLIFSILHFFRNV